LCSLYFKARLERRMGFFFEDGYDVGLLMVVMAHGETQARAR
jgi:hypothetical protein